MKSIRLITIQDDGQVEWTPDRMDETIEGRQAAIQRFLIQLMTSPGTYIENAQLGGGIPTLLSVSRGESLSDVKMKITDKIQRVQRMLTQTEPDREPHTITDVTLNDVTRQPERGLDITVTLDFYNATSKQLTFPAGSHGAK